MKEESFTLALLTDRAPDEVFDAINNVRGWWSGDIDGDTDRVGAEFAYRHGNVHRSRQKVSSLVPDSRVAWNVLESDLDFLKHRNEWDGTNIVFEVSKKIGLGSSQRTVQRAMDALAGAGKVQSVGRGRARRWMTPPARNSTADVVREYTFPGVDDVHGVTYDGERVWSTAVCGSRPRPQLESAVRYPTDASLAHGRRFSNSRRTGFARAKPTSCVC